MTDLSSHPYLVIYIFLHILEIEKNNIGHEFGQQGLTNSQRLEIINLAPKMNTQKESQKDTRLKAIFNAASDTFVVTDDRSVILDINKAGCKLFNQKRSSLLKTKLIDYLLPETKSEVNKLWKRFLKKGSQQGEWLIRNRILAYNATANFYEQQHLVALRDITDQKIEEKRQEHFLNIASHELRSPLASIKAFAQMLKRYFKDSGDEKINSYLTKIDNKVDLMAEVISDLLDVTRIRQDKLVFFPESFNFDQYLTEIVEDMRSSSNNHRILVSGEMVSDMYADKNRVGQVITNLLKNAVKYSPMADKVVLNINPDEKEIVISVQDFGMGISKEDQSKIFDLYFRGTDDKKNGISGLGVGLYICAQIVQQMGGKIWVESKVNKGSTFYVSIPK